MDRLDELTGKGDIDTIGKYHSQRMVKGMPNSKYHVVMRNRAARLRSLRDHSGPNPDATKISRGRKQMLKYAGEDSRLAKKLKESTDNRITHKGVELQRPVDKKAAAKRKAKQTERAKAFDAAQKRKDAVDPETRSKYASNLAAALERINAKKITEEAPTNCVGDGTKIAGIGPNDVGVKRNKKILTFKQMMSRNNVSPK